MDDYEFVDEEIEDYTDSYQELAIALANVLNLSNKLTFSFVIHLNPTSFLYKEFYKIIKSLDDKKLKRMHYVGRKAIIREEETERDRVISRMTATFLPEIKKFLSEEQILLSDPAIENIDSFLYLINSNYFKKIKSRNPNTRREFLIEEILYVISSCLKVSGKATFDNDLATQVLNACIFIPEDLKREIITEFRDSRTKQGNYQIVRKDIAGGKDSYIAEKNADNMSNNRIPEFDINMEGNIIAMIKATEACKEFQELEIGSAENLSWDVHFLQKFMLHIDNNHHRDLVILDEKYSKFALTESFILDTMIYAVLNKKELVTADVMINAFSNWDYLPFDIKLAVLDEIFENEELDYSLHPYRDKKPEAEKTYQKKTIQFKSLIPKN